MNPPSSPTRHGAALAAFESLDRRLRAWTLEEGGEEQR
jgi:hypothetical protein